MSSPLAKKLQIKPGHRVAVVNVPDGYMSLIEPLPDGATLVPAAEADGACDAVLLFARSVADLEAHAPLALSAVRYDGLLWGAYPKKTADVKTDINRDHGWDAFNKAGIRPVTQIAIDETWSALRWRPLDKVGK